MVFSAGAADKINEGVDVDKEEGRKGETACTRDCRGPLAEAEGKLDSAIF